MSKSSNNGRTSHRQLFAGDLSRNIRDHSKAINNKHELLPHETEDRFKSDENLTEYNFESAYSKSIPSNERRFTDSQQTSISTSSHDEKSIQDLIERLKIEEQSMMENLQSIELGEAYIRDEIKLMKHREKRMEYEIERMKRHEKSLEVVSIRRNSGTTEEKDITAEIKLLRKHEVHVSYEIQRMEHYRMHNTSEIQSIEREFMHMKKYDEKPREPDFQSSETRDEPQQNKYLHSNCRKELEQLYSELEKRKMRLVDHYNEIKKRKAKLEEYHVKRTKCEHKLATIKREEAERIQRKKQPWKDAVRQRKHHEKVLATCRTRRLRREIELIETIAKRMKNELQSMTDDDKLREHGIQCSKVLEELLIEHQKLYTLLSQFKRQQYEPGLLITEKIERHLIYYGNSDNTSHRPYQSFDVHSETVSINELPKYDLFISSIDQNDTTIGCIKNALPQWFSVHVKGNFSSTNIKICLDNTSTVVLAIINRQYELSITCQAEMIHIFKRQFPLVLITTDEDFEPSTDWLNIVWRASNTQKVFVRSSDVEDKLRHAIAAAQWNLMSQVENSEATQLSTNERSKRFLGDVHEWTVAYSNPARVSYSYRQLITDPFRIETDTKLQDIYYNYIRIYFENSDVMRLFEKGASHNNITDFIRAYTWNNSFNSAFNRHLAANVLFYFEPILYDTIDYQLVKSLIDFAALLIYRRELSRYLFTGTVYRGVVMSEADRHKYIVGSRVMNTSFLSTSRSREVAEFFSGEKQQELTVVCTYVIHNNNNRRTALDISSMSKFPHEREVLILPFSPFYVKSITPPSEKSKAIEIMLVEDDFDILENIDLLTSIDY